MILSLITFYLIGAAITATLLIVMFYKRDILKFKQQPFTFILMGLVGGLLWCMGLVGMVGHLYQSIMSGYNGHQDKLKGNDDEH